ncbi:MAG: efflux RND transporter periplasmic adaptor subunit [Peptostreptococcaceae bacterium]|jgi:multidrug efflux pump subunit AcrA (membrane-fusion protein)|nr:efflux RND transporter periplasmic adaptor subunit [Peptostreptococcaceae bacterium]
MNKKIILIISIMIVSLFAFTKLYFTNAKAESENTNNTFEKEFKVTKQNIEKSFETTGVINLNTYDISFETQGILERLNIEAGQIVQKGDILGSLESKDISNNYNTALNSLEEAKLNLQKTKEERQRNLISLENNLINSKNDLDTKKESYENAVETKELYSQNEIDELKEKYEEAKRDYDLKKKEYDFEISSSIDSKLDNLSIEKAKDKVEEAKENLDNVNLKSPIAGKIVNINKKEGEKILEENTFVQIASDMEITTDITELDISKVEIGMEVEITFDAILNQKYKGKVKSISELGEQSNSGITNYEVIIEILGDTNQLKDSMNCSIKFLLEKKENVLTVPKKAVSYSRDNNSMIVTIVDDEGKKSIKEVEVGISNEYQTEIVSGLNEGEKVLVSVNLNSTNENRKSTMMIPMGGGNKRK